MIPPKPTINQATSIRLQQNKKYSLSRQRFTQQMMSERSVDRDAERAKNRSFAIKEASLEARNAKRVKRNILDSSNEGLLASSSDMPHKFSIQTSRNSNLNDLNTLVNVTPGGSNLATLDPINEQSFLRKQSLNLPAQRKAIALYKAPVVKERYKRVISHFNKPKNSFQPTKLEPIFGKVNKTENDLEIN